MIIFRDREDLIYISSILYNIIKIMSNNRILLENAIAEGMLQEIYCNLKIKSVLNDIATILHSNVFIHASGCLKQYEDYEEIPQPLKEVINSWAVQHSQGDRFYGALLPECSLDKLKKTGEGRLLLLSAMEKTLSVDNIQTLSTLHNVLSLIKTFDGLGYYYLSDAHSKSNLEEYLLIKSMIFPSDEESKLRRVRNENLVAMTYGIGNEINKDLIHQENETKGAFPGKARFFIPPLDKHSPWFQKLAREKESLQPLPLIASVSFSASRSLITLLHLGAFNQSDGKKFDLEKAQIYANCLMSYYVFCGHHSFLEVMEVWNRVLDYVAIYHPEQLPAEIFPKMPSEQPYINQIKIEDRLPYGHVGNYKHFLNVNYADTILKSAESGLLNQENRFALK